MEKEDFEVLSGQVAALNTVLTKLLTTLTPYQAAVMAAEVAIEKESLRDVSDYATPEKELAVQERMLDAYIELLSAVANSG